MIYNLGLYPYLSDTPKLDHLGIHGELDYYKKKFQFYTCWKKTREIQKSNSIYKGEAKKLREID